MTNKRVQEYIQSLKSINLEITSLCNMSKEHCTQCPNAWRAQKFGNTKIKTPLIEQFFKDLASNQYTGLTAFHSYNEPLMDKRIFDIIEMHKKICGAARVMVLSNGRLLTQKKADRLMELKVDKITISAYEYSTFKRMEEMFDKLKIDNPDCEFDINHQTLDGRMQYYSYPTRKEIGLPTIQPCKRVKDQLVITATGDVQLCCYEWKRELNFGNINNKNILKILEDSNYLDVRDDLIKGYRDKYYPCDRCIYAT